MGQRGKRGGLKGPNKTGNTVEETEKKGTGTKGRHGRRKKKARDHIKEEKAKPQTIRVESDDEGTGGGESGKEGGEHGRGGTGEKRRDSSEEREEEKDGRQRTRGGRKGGMIRKSGKTGGTNKKATGRAWGGGVEMRHRGRGGVRQQTQ